MLCTLLTEDNNGIFRDLLRRKKKKEEALDDEGGFAPTLISSVTLLHNPAKSEQFCWPCDCGISDSLH